MLSVCLSADSMACRPRGGVTESACAHGQRTRLAGADAGASPGARWNSSLKTVHSFASMDKGGCPIISIFRYLI